MHNPPHDIKESMRRPSFTVEARYESNPQAMEETLLLVLGWAKIQEEAISEQTDQ